MAGWLPVTHPSWISGHFQAIWGSGVNNVYAVGFGNKDSKDNPLLSYGGPDTTAPGSITNFTVSVGAVNGSAKLSWTAPADDGPNPPDPSAGPVASYTVKYSTSALTDCSSGTSATSPVPVTPGTTQTMTISGLTLGTPYYFAVCAQDEASPPNQTAAVTASKTFYPGVGMYDDRNAVLTYTGTWATWDGTGPYSNTMSYTNASGATATFKFQAPARSFDDQGFLQSQ